jgi:hypothetical protein
MSADAVVVELPHTSADVAAATDGVYTEHLVVHAQPLAAPVPGTLPVETPLDRLAGEPVVKRCVVKLDENVAFGVTGWH